MGTYANQASYVVGMDQDENSYPIPKTSTKLTGADGIIPVDVQNHLTQSIVALNAVALTIAGGATPSSTSSAITCDGFNEISIVAHSSVSHNGRFQVLWSYDNTNFSTAENVQTQNNNINSGTYSDRFATIPVRAPYCKIEFDNLDGTATPTVTNWVYLKA